MFARARKLIVLLALTGSVAPTQILAQTKRISADAAPALARFAQDSLAAIIPVALTSLTVRAERGTTVPTTGRYLVLREGRTVAAAISPELMLGAPSIALISLGEPSVVVLSTYTGGQGVRAYYLKVLILTESSTTAYTLDSESIGEVPSDQVRSLTRAGRGQFTATLQGGLSLTVRDGHLEVAQQR